MTRRAAVFALTCAAVGLIASTAAAVTHYHLLYDPTYRSFCDVSERISCTQVYSSRFSTFMGIPVAIFGGIWFAVAGLFFLLPRTADAAFSHFTSRRIHIPGFTNNVTLGDIGEIKNSSRPVMHISVISAELPACSCSPSWRNA